MKYLLSFWIVFCTSIQAIIAQKQAVTEADYQNTAVEMADVMRTNGKIYVVVVVMAVVLLGIALYLFRIDRKISQLEK